MQRSAAICNCPGTTPSKRESSSGDEGDGTARRRRTGPEPATAGGRHGPVVDRRGVPCSAREPAAGCTLAVCPRARRACRIREDHAARAVGAAGRPCLRVRAARSARDGCGHPRRRRCRRSPQPRWAGSRCGRSIGCRARVGARVDRDAVRARSRRRPRAGPRRLRRRHRAPQARSRGLDGSAGRARAAASLPAAPSRGRRAARADPARPRLHATRGAVAAPVDGRRRLGCAARRRGRTHRRLGRGHPAGRAFAARARAATPTWAATCNPSASRPSRPSSARSRAGRRSSHASRRRSATPSSSATTPSACSRASRARRCS